MPDVSAISIAASLLVMLSIWFGWLSFRFAEEGAPPDELHDPFHVDLEPEKNIIIRGRRSRQRVRARLFFNLGALCLLSSVPLGYANARDQRLSSIFVILSGAIIIGAVCYVGISLRALWLDRRDDAFTAWYVGKKFGQFYRNEPALRKMFFSMNPMPFWTSLVQRDWERHLVYPNADQAIAANSPVTPYGDLSQTDSEQIESEKRRLNPGRS